MYATCVLTSLLYDSETWTLNQHQVKVLESFHQYYLRHHLGIKWEYLTPDTEVLQKAKSASISMRVMKSHMRWTGHFVRMGDDRLPKRLFYGELSEGKYPQHKPRKRFNDNIKDNMGRMQINAESWESLANGRDKWRAHIHKGLEEYESSRISRAELKRATRKQDISNILSNLGHV